MGPQITQKEYDKYLELAQQGWSADRISKKFNRDKYKILYWARKNNIKFRVPVVYCIICGEQVEDETKNKTRTTCSITCYRKKEAKRKVAYHKKYDEVAKLKRLETETVRNKFPKWRCQFGHEQQLDFNITKWYNTKKLLAMACKTCENEKTV